MASAKPIFFILLLVTGFLVLSNPVSCNDEEDKLFQGLNSYRKSLNLSELKKNKKAACLADELADELQDSPCSSASSYPIKPGNAPQFPGFYKLIKRCDIDINTTSDGIILPVCVPHLDQDLVLNNYTHTKYAKYLNESTYTGAGVGSEEDWMIVVLTTDAQDGSFSGAAYLGTSGMIHYMVASLFVLFLSLIF